MAKWTLWSESDEVGKFLNVNKATFPFTITRRIVQLIKLKFDCLELKKKMVCP